MKFDFDVIVVGGGHAGIEAALASARLGAKTLLITMNVETIGYMSCNPAMGGTAKGHLVREIDALGGEMAFATDMAGIHYRVLNRSKGYAVRSTRAQCDRALYRDIMKKTVLSEPNLSLFQAQVTKILVRNNKVEGVVTNFNHSFYSKAVVLAPGTFMNGLIHIGLEHFPAGRAGEPPSIGLSDCLRGLGFEMGRLKTGTTPRLDGRTIDFSSMEKMPPEEPKPFSWRTESIPNPQIPCYITYTNEKTHEIIRKSLDRSPLYSGIIVGIGPRYCPSIEDKVVKFPHRTRHQIFLEPDGLDEKEFYPSGISSSLPLDVQISYLHTIPGLENVRVIRPGYAIEYDFLQPKQLKETLETEKVRGLFTAGQINGTSGYEEAGAQGIIAGINAFLYAKGEGEFILYRDEAMIGVLINDLVSKGVDEPYRMFTSRAEHRLILRETNADLRLTEKGRSLGLVKDEQYRKFLEKKRKVEKLLEYLREKVVRPDENINRLLSSLDAGSIKEPVRMVELLKRPRVSLDLLENFFPEIKGFPPSVKEEVEAQVKYEGYIKREMEIIENLKNMRLKKIPENFDFSCVKGLTKEAIEKLNKAKPKNLEEASRVRGVNPAHLFAIEVALKKISREAGNGGKRGDSPEIP